jgi:adenylosuccinate synthase
MKKYSNSYAVIGLGFGDEGKGLTVNSLCQQLDDSLVVRFSGGQQAGHTVTLPDGRKHTFSNFGSGTFQNTPTYWSKYCTFDPVGVMVEYDLLKEKGVQPTLFIDARSPVTTPYDKRYNRTTSKALEHGTCGTGVGATFEREEKLYSLLAGDLLYPSVLKIKLDMIKKYYGTEASTEQFFECCQMVREKFEIVTSLPDALNYIFEGSQGLLLDQNIGFFPHVTRSNVGSKNVLEIVAENSLQQPKIFLITRAFQTRHGNGPLTNSSIPHNITNNPNEDNILNKYQGEFKKSLLDLDLLRYAIDKDPYIKSYHSNNLVITCLDLVRNEYRYTAEGSLIYHTDEDSFVSSIGKALNIEIIHRISSPQGVIDIGSPRYRRQF